MSNGAQFNGTMLVNTNQDPSSPTVKLRVNGEIETDTQLYGGLRSNNDEGNFVNYGDLQAFVMWIGDQPVEVLCRPISFA
jgi:hypothetical protein